MSTLVVTNLGDSGAGSLRQAILDANGFAGADLITFAVAGPISLLSALPTVTDGVDIDATSAPGFSGTPVVAIDVAIAGLLADGLVFAGVSGSTVKGLAIVNFAGNGIKLDGASNVSITGNHIGVDLTGTAAAPNGADGILITNGATGNVIGGTSAADRNLISGNQTNGVEIDASDGNTISGNLIGSDVTGTVALGNLGDGVLITNGSTGNTVGGTAAGAGNQIAYNADAGVSVDSGVDNAIHHNAISQN